MSDYHFNSFFQLIITILTQVYTWLTSIQIGPLNLFTWLVGIVMVSAIFSVIHMLSGVNGSGALSHGIVAGAEAGRFKRSTTDDEH